MAESMAGLIAAGAQRLEIPLAEPAAARLARYAELLLEWNQQVNLTSITEPSEVALKHFVDSLSVLRAVAEPVSGLKAVDIGSGAGFPGLVLAIVRPDWHWTLLDAAAKRVTFLSAVIGDLGLTNAVAVQARAEDAGRQTALREGFDLAVARAVARLNTLAEYCLPLVRVGGEFIAMKARTAGEEAQEARQAIRLLGGELLGAEHFELGEAGGERALVRIRKVAPTPTAYPRRAGTPERKPL